MITHEKSYEKLKLKCMQTLRHECLLALIFMLRLLC